MTFHALPPLMSQTAHLMTRMRSRLQSLAYSSSLYQLMISGPVPKVLVTIPNDPWPGSATAGQSIIDGRFQFAGQNHPSFPPEWHPGDAKPSWMEMVHSFIWLRDLRAVGGDAARRMARSLLDNWLDQYADWAPEVWEPALVADRITHLVGMHDFFLASADSSYRARVFECIVRQLKHLQRILPGALAGILQIDHEANSNVQLPAATPLQGVDLLRAVRGLVFAGVALPDGEKALGLALSIAPALIRSAMTADGAARERSPAAQLELLSCLIDIRQALKAGGLALPPELPAAIDKAASALKFYRHGDGGLSLFNGANEGSVLMIDAALNLADSKSRAQKALAHAGFERVHAGRMLLVMDVGAGPAQGLDKHAHAGLGSFELSVGRERLIVNCGSSHTKAADEWHHALAATAAHSTLSINATNSSELLKYGGLGRRANVLEEKRFAQAGAQHVAIAHDGYMHLNARHQRMIAVRDDGEDVSGQDIINGPEGLRFDLRFHLHPLVQVSLIQNNAAALLRLPSGAGFRLRVEMGTLELSESLYFGLAHPRRTQQLVLSGLTLPSETRINWAIAREK